MGQGVGLGGRLGTGMGMRMGMGDLGGFGAGGGSAFRAPFWAGVGLRPHRAPWVRLWGAVSPQAGRRPHGRAGGDGAPLLRRHQLAGRGAQEGQRRHRGVVLWCCVTVVVSWWCGVLVRMICVVVLWCCVVVVLCCVVVVLCCCGVVLWWRCGVVVLSWWCVVVLWYHRGGGVVVWCDCVVVVVLCRGVVVWCCVGLLCCIIVLCCVVASLC